ncbi:tetratricopeptide repeat protein 12 isoform X2 [Silurus asotus]|uniref:Tetratricopeptide repeat protein 12 isoform X2 n=1 Tax=Silurus asotus TaxID=30991 RepID=A0AAD5AQJ0_SILAS|nr:tetratricopeptide repeat protein 12 isoform X2 [Silurus asotus]
MASCESEDLERFLTNVEQISELVKEMNSADVATQKKAVEKADCLVESLEEQKTSKSHINRTVINTSPSCGSRPVNATCVASESPENFRKALEKDAEERRKRRQVKEKEANVLKEKGNQAFALGDYKLAVKMYTEGLEKLRDMPALYTNRAQALIKLEKYKEAISDCEWALKCNEKCIKAYVHMGRAHLGLRHFAESRLCYEKILDTAPEHEPLVKDYLTQVDLEEKKVLQEETALREFNDGKEEAVAIPDLLTKLERPNMHNLYYCGGLELLAQAVSDSIGQTLFRLNNGFRVIADNNNIKTGKPAAVTAMSQHKKTDCPVVNLHFISSPAGMFNASLHVLSDPAWETLGNRKPQSAQANITGSSHILLPRFISMIGAMSADEVVINKLVCREEFWKSSFSAMGRCASCEYRNILYPLLGLMINMASNQTPAIQEDAIVGCTRCVALLSDPDGGIITRAVGLLSVVLPKSEDAIQEVVQQGVVKKLLKILKGEGQTSSRYSIKAMAVCTASSQQAREELVKLDKRLVTMRKLLGRSDELVVGNTALCLGHCLTVQGAATSLLGTDCVMLLLRQVAGKSKRADVQQNAAITLGKLCRAEPRYTKVPFPSP